MFSTYLLFKFLHISAAIVWIGGAFTLSVINARLAREKDQAALEALSRQSSFFGSVVFGPAAAITLIAGIVMVAVSGFSFGTFWITWGFVGIFGSVLLGGVFTRRVGERLSKLASTAEAIDPRMARLQKRLSILNVIDLLVLLSVVWAMVFKPTL